MGFENVIFRRAAWIWLATGLMLLSVPGWAQDRIWAEAHVSEEGPYVQQLVTYIVRVYSRGNLRSIEISPPSGSGVSLEELEGPLTSTTTQRGRRQIVSEFRYALIPMVEGVIEVGPTRLTVTPSDNGRSQYGRGANPWQRSSRGADRTVQVSTRGLKLHARDPIRGVQPWLPLEHLGVEAHWTKADKPGLGEPMTLTVTMKALGAKGSQLPSLESLIETDEFKVYPERPQTDWKFGSDGEALWGRRIETYTLVPTREGRLVFPAILVPWWNVQAGRESVAKVPGRVFTVGEGAGGDVAETGWEAPAFLSSLMSDDTVVYYLLPVGGGLLIAFIFGLWIGTGKPGSQVLRRAESAGVPESGTGGKLAAMRGAANAVPKVWARRAWLGVQGMARRIRRLGETTLAAGVTLLPKRAKSWWCVRCVGTEPDPVSLCRTLRRFACDELSMNANAPLPAIADRISEERPRADTAPLRNLFRELEAAAYGGQGIDLTKWKRSFGRRFRRILRSRKREESATRDAGLPRLNP